MKVIDLLNKIANGEEVPHFKIFEIEYFLNDRGNLREKEEDRPSEDTRWYIDSKWLNTEVEIIEEDNIEKIKDINTDYYVKELYYDNLSKEEITLDIQTLKHKVNEIIDKLNEMEKE